MMLDVCDSSPLVSKLTPTPPPARRGRESNKRFTDKLPDKITAGLIDSDSFIVVARPPIAPRNGRRPVQVSRPALLHLKSADLINAEKKRLQKKAAEMSMTKRNRSQSEINLHGSLSRNENKHVNLTQHRSRSPTSIEEQKATKARQRRAIYALNKLMTELENQQFGEFLSSGCSCPTGV